jgi:hypothetical protein
VLVALARQLRFAAVTEATPSLRRSPRRAVAVVVVIPPGFATARLVALAVVVVALVSG